MSGWVIGVNVTLPVPYHLVDVSRDTEAILTVALPFLFVFLGGIGFVVYHTDDDGYVYGRRTIESKDVRRRQLATAMSYIFEGLQLCSCSFGRASTVSLMGGWAFHGASKVFLWLGPVVITLAACATIQLFLMIFVIVPLILWFAIKRDTFNKFAAWYISGKLGNIVSFLQDCFLLYFTVPIMIALTRSIPCTYYETGEAATALDDSTECGSSYHKTNAIAGAVIFLLSFAMGVASGSLPALVARHGDLALNGRFVGVSFALKSMIAVMYVTSSERNRYIHLGVTIVLQFLLLFVSFSMRPCLVERVNFHRSAVYSISVLTSAMCILGSGIDDVRSPLPITAGVVGIFVLIFLLVSKYYFLVCHKLFPAIDFEDGEYEGDLSLGHDLPHGHGVLTWPFEDRIFTGNFFLGKVHGYGVLTFGKVFYQGEHKDGRRHGFGMTNIMENDVEESYEGFWEDDLPVGEGTKKFVDGDVFEGIFVGGFEHGMGKWSFNTSLGRTDVIGVWENGLFLGISLEEDQEYQGEIRYGVPHGEGLMTIGDDTFEGEWRAGKMHGYGRVEMIEGTYEGHFREGNYSDDGIWKDANGTYSGKFRNGLKHGHGREETSEGAYEGTFEEGFRSGYGTFTYTSGAVYQGSWLNNEYHGTGLLVTDEYEYDGNWDHGKKQGERGHITFSNGVEYVGSWEADQFHGDGWLRIPHLGDFEGRFLEGNRTGLGKMSLFDGSEYVGEWDLDLPHGRGTFTFTSPKSVIMLATMEPFDIPEPRTTKSFMDFGGEFNGFFVDGEMSGEGTLVAQDGSKYVGEFEHSKPNGYGVLTLSSGGHYEGDWVDGEREGQGTMLYADGRSYVGEWARGRRQGHGTLIGTNGETINECDWNGDLPVQKQDINMDVIVIPTIDIDEFLRDIMPSAISPVELLETRFRKRLEMEEIYRRIRVSVIVDEEGSAVRLYKNFFYHVLNTIRAETYAAFTEEANQIQQATLAKVLNAWKTTFRAENGREPKKSDLTNSEVAPIYKRYLDLTSTNM